MPQQNERKMFKHKGTEEDILQISKSNKYQNQAGIQKNQKQADI